MIQIFFFLPRKGKFLQNFANNEQLRFQAEQVWNKLDELSLILIILAAFIGIILAIYYYTGYNELPGRHYKIRYWSIWAAIAFSLSLVVTAIIEYVGINTSIRTGMSGLYWSCALNNAFYSFVFYFITSLAWCNFLPTNAYKFLKL